MKRFIKEIIIILIQLFMFYIFPLFAGPTDAMGMVFVIWLITLLLSILIATISKSRVRYLYPIMISAVFIPSIFIYYNISALIHCVWYFIDSSIGMLIGLGISRVITKSSKKI